MADDKRLLFGREEELAALKEAIARPEGQIVLTIGGEGRGKTSLLEQLNAELAEDKRYFGLLYRLNLNDTSEAFLYRLMGDLLNISDLTKHRLVLNAPRQVDRWKTLAKLIPSVGDAVSGLIPDDRRPMRDQFLGFLHAAAGRLKEGQRLVLIFDPDEYLDKSQGPDWGTLSQGIPNGVTIIFAQRPDDVLAESETLLTSPKTQRIPEEPLGHLPREKSDALIAGRWQEQDGWRKLGAEPAAELSGVLWEKYEGWPLPLTMVLADLPEKPDGLDKLLAAAEEMPKKLHHLLNLRYGKAAAKGGDAVRLLQGLAILERPAAAERVAALCGEGCSPAGLASAASQPAVAKCVPPGEKGLLYFFHATMGECVRAQMSDEAKQDLHQRAAGLYEKDLDKNKSDKEALDRFPYHAYEAYHVGDPKLFLDALDRVGTEKDRLRLLRSYQRDLQWALRSCRDLAEAEPDAFLPRVAAVLTNLGGVLGDLGELVEARQALEEAVAIYVKRAAPGSGAFDPNAATTINSLGTVLRALGQQAEARKAYDAALAMYRILADPELVDAEPAAFEPDLAMTLSNRGNVLRELGERAQARQDLEEALVIRRKLAQADRAAFEPDVAMTLNSLGTVLSELGEQAQARKAFEDALSIRRKLAEAERDAFLPGVAETLNNLGAVLIKLEEQSLARQALEEALSVGRKLAEAEPAAFLPGVAMTLSNLGGLLTQMGKAEDAQLALEEALAVYKKLAEAAPDAFLPNVAVALNHLGNVLRGLGEQTQAREAFEEALSICRELAKGEPAVFERDVAMTLNNLGILLRELEQWTEARSAYDEALAIYTRCATAEPGTFAGDLMEVVGNATMLLEKTGESLDEWPALVEAATLLAVIRAVQQAGEQDDKQDDP